MAKRSAKADEKTARPPGRPPFEPTDDQRHTVECMASAGIPQDDIAKVIGIAKCTLQEHFRDELDNGKARTITKVADSLVRQALAGNTAAAIFYLKTQGRWREAPQQHEVTGKDGEAVKVETTLSDTDLARKVAFMLAAAKESKE